MRLRDPNYFAKVFRRYYGASPTEFRTSGMYLSVAAKSQEAVKSLSWGKRIADVAASVLSLHNLAFYVLWRAPSN